MAFDETGMRFVLLRTTVQQRQGSSFCMRAIFKDQLLFQLILSAYNTVKRELLNCGLIGNLDYCHYVIKTSITLIYGGPVSSR
jgi:hypothetical protein